MRLSVVLVLATLMVAGLLLAYGAFSDETFVPGADDSARAPVDPPVLLVRSGRRVPASWAARAAAIPGVEDALFVRRGQMLLERVTDPTGTVIQEVRRGYAIPVDTLVADTSRYAAMLPGPARSVVAGLRPGEVVLTSSAALMRGVDLDDVLAFEGGELRVGGIVEDGMLNGAEALTGGSSARGIQIRAGLVLARVSGPSVLGPVRRAFARDRAAVLWRGFPYGTGRGAIVQPAELKSRFGEVAARVPFGRDWVRLDPDWVQANIVKEPVPILGEVKCNRVLIDPLRNALGELERRGLARLVDRGDFAGCYAPRRIPQTGSLSLHALGLAVDLNAKRNPYDRPSRQDPRLVRVMEKHGFTWGGAWPTVKDAMHFEWQGRVRK